MRDLTPKEEVYRQLFEEYQEFSNLDDWSKKYIFETWKMTKEIHEHLGLKNK